MTTPFLYGSAVGFPARRARPPGRLANTLVIVTSDHGEHLGDHQLFFHGCSLYRQLVQVPLVIVGKAAGVPAGRTVAEPVSLHDLPASVLELLGINQDRAPTFGGQSVARYWRRATRRALASWLRRCSWRRRSRCCS